MEGVKAHLLWGRRQRIACAACQWPRSTEGSRLLAFCLPSRLFWERPCPNGVLLLRLRHVKVCPGEGWLSMWLLLPDCVVTGDGRYAPGLLLHVCVSIRICGPTMGLFFVCCPNVLGVPQCRNHHVYSWIRIDHWVVSMAPTCHSGTFADQAGTDPTCRV